MRLTVTALALAVCACGGSTPEGGWTEGEPPEWADEARADGGLGIIANNAFFYYADVEAADDFYTRVLGIRKVADYGFAKILLGVGTGKAQHDKRQSIKERDMDRELRRAMSKRV